MKKRSISMLLTLALCSGFSVPALAADTKTVSLADGDITISNVLYETTVNEGFQDEPGRDSDLMAQERTVYWVADTPGTTLAFPGGEVGETIGFDGYVIDGDELVQEGGTFTVKEMEAGETYALTVSLTEEERAYSEFYGENGAFFITFRDLYFSIGFVKAESLATDSPSDWAAAYVEKAIAEKLVPAALQGKYTAATTRAEFCALAVALFETVTGKAIEGRVEFTDTDDVNVQKMASLDVVNGVAEGIFAPNDNLTREQAATMLTRLAEAFNKPLEAQTPTFADNALISDWAFGAVGQMQCNGIMGGVGANTFAPGDQYTREQSITTILRLFDIMK